MRFIMTRTVFMRLLRLLADVTLSIAAFCTITILPLLLTVGPKPFYHSNGPLMHLAIYSLVTAVALIAARTYRTIWRFVSFRDLLSIAQASTLTVVGFSAIEYVFLHPGTSISSTLVLMTIALVWIANVGFLVAPRLIARLLYETRLLPWRRSANGAHAPLPILLTGDAARMDAFIRECDRDPESRYRVVGVLTRDAKLHGSYLHGVLVLGSDNDLSRILTRLNRHGIRPHTLVLAKDNATGPDFFRLLELTASTNIKIGRLPPTGLFDDRTSVQPIELADLLGRPEVKIDAQALTAMIRGKCVMITGAGGSIGSELSRQIAGLKPSRLVVVDFSEFNLYSIDKELNERFPDIERQTALFDVRDRELVSYWIGKTRPEVVFHAAALKHVPMLEDHPIEAVKTNIFGTINVADACIAHHVAAMVTISTDKAVNPCNVMGATKRLAEAYCQGVDQAADSPGTTRFITVRFGNVLGSAGSVVPLFQRQIQSGGPITVTHPEINRFFMTIPEAVTLVLQAGAQGLGVNDERGSIYILDMGQPVKIIDLAKQMIRLAGLRPDIDVKIQIVGLRPGEKLYEEVMHNDESVLPTRHESILKLAPRATNLRIIQQQAQELRTACLGGDRERVLRLLHICVPEYVSETMQHTA